MIANHEHCLEKPQREVAALAALAHIHGLRISTEIRHAWSQAGTVVIDGAACTGCQACAETRPIDALRSETEAEEVRRTFNASVCVASGICGRQCPERTKGAIFLTKAVRIAANIMLIVAISHNLLRWAAELG